MNAILDEMIEAMRRSGDVSFPFGQRVKRLSERWLPIGDEPMKHDTVEHLLFAEGGQLLDGSKAPGTGPGRR